MADSDINSSIKWFNDMKKVIKAGEVLTNDPNAEI